MAVYINQGMFPVSATTLLQLRSLNAGKVLYFLKANSHCSRLPISIFVSLVWPSHYVFLFSQVLEQQVRFHLGSRTLPAFVRNYLSYGCCGSLGFVLCASVHYLLWMKLRQSHDISPFSLKFLLFGIRGRSPRECFTCCSSWPGTSPTSAETQPHFQG